ncbi:signal-regulatory protein beta-1-like [Pelobates fuscus]|uniref:signal-regulatory protein beta-1-like n=1 Tax=Pelobates fuscus TaxID=191477 RepID=UPI002FE47783
MELWRVKGRELLLLLLFMFLHSGVALELTAPSTYKAIVGSETSIPCTLTVDRPTVNPRFLVIFWYFQGKEILSYDDTLTRTDDRFSINTTRIIDGDVSLYISRVTVTDSGLYTCVVIYSPNKKGMTVSLTVEALPKVTITRRIGVMNKESVLNCSVIGFYPMDIDIKWLKNGQTLYNYRVFTPQRNPDDTYSVHSTVTVIPTEEDRNQIFSCRVQHESLSKPLQEDFKLIYGAPPMITITSKTAVMNEESILRSTITGFYPVNIDIKWLRNGEILNNYTVSTPQMDIDNTYSVNSTVTIIPSEEDRNQIFSCRVQHESLSVTLHKDFTLEYTADKGSETKIIHIINSVTLAIIAIIIIAACCFWIKYKNLRSHPAQPRSVERVVQGEEHVVTQPVELGALQIAERNREGRINGLYERMKRSKNKKGKKENIESSVMCDHTVNQLLRGEEADAETETPSVSRDERKTETGKETHIHPPGRETKEEAVQTELEPLNEARRYNVERLEDPYKDIFAKLELQRFMEDGDLNNSFEPYLMGGHRRLYSSNITGISLEENGIDFRMRDSGTNTAYGSLVDDEEFEPCRIGTSVFQI